MFATVPFDILLGNDCRILYVPFPDYVFSEDTEVIKRAAVCGNPVITEQNIFEVSQLHESEQECNYAKEALQKSGYMTETFSGQGAGGALPFNKNVLLDSLRKERYSIIHISTHGFYEEQHAIPSLEVRNVQDNPYRRCGLILNDCFSNGQYSIVQSVLWGGVQIIFVGFYVLIRKGIRFFDTYAFVN